MCKEDDKTGHHIIFTNSSYIPGSGVILELIRHMHIVQIHKHMHAHIRIHKHTQNLIILLIFSQTPGAVPISPISKSVSYYVIAGIVGPNRNTRPVTYCTGRCFVVNGPRQ